MKIGFLSRGTIIFTNEEGYSVQFHGEMLVDGFWIYEKRIECLDSEGNLITDNALCEKLIAAAKTFAETSECNIEFDIDSDDN